MGGTIYLLFGRDDAHEGLGYIHLYVDLLCRREVFGFGSKFSETL